MASREHHTAWEIIGGDRVHDEDHNDVGWVDKNDDVHKPGDTGVLWNPPETIGHVNSDGSVTMGNKK